MNLLQVEYNCNQFEVQLLLALHCYIDLIVITLAAPQYPWVEEFLDHQTDTNLLLLHLAQYKCKAIVT